jgi:heptosyltransferase-1
MGDILHALPAVTALRQAHPEWVIDWVVEPRWRALLAAERSEHVDQVLRELPEEHASGAKARVDSAGLMRGLKPPPPSESSFSVACEAAPLQSGRGPAQPVVDRLHLAPSKDWRRAPLSPKTIREIKALRSALRAGGYDAVLDLQGAVRSAAVGRLAGCPRLIGEAEPRERMARWLFTERVATRGAHVIEQDVELASAVAGDALAPVAPWLPVDAAAEAWANKILPPGDLERKQSDIESHPSDKNPPRRTPRLGHPSSSANHQDAPAVLISPGAGWGAKRWPVERYAAVAKSLADRGLRVLVNAGPGEEPLAGAIVQGAGGAAAALTCSLTQLIALTRRIALCIAGDTGPLHLACALGRPVVGIYGPTDPSRNGPFGTRFRVLRSPDSRRDHARRAAPEAGLLTIQPEDVLRAADEQLAEETAP